MIQQACSSTSAGSQSCNMKHRPDGARLLLIPAASDSCLNRPALSVRFHCLEEEGRSLLRISGFPFFLDNRLQTAR